MRRIVFIAITTLFATLLLSACGETADQSAGEAGTTSESTAAGADRTGTLLFTIGMHIEPLGATPSALSGTDASPVRRQSASYTNPELFQRHVTDIQTVAGIVESHGGHMTIQAQSPFTSTAVSTGSTVLADLAANGHEIGLHFHEDAHLGKDTENLPVETWCAVMREEIELIRQASGLGDEDIRYFSGGNLYPGLLDAAACAGLDVNSDWKNPLKQETAPELIGLNPWRPAGGTSGEDVSRFAIHDPAGSLVFLPEGQYERTDFASMRRTEWSGSDQAYFDFLKESLMNSLANVDPDKVNVFHFTVHPGEFRGDPDHPFEVIDRFLTEVVDPLVESGQVEWATLSEMADAYAAWEAANPGVEPRP